MGGNFHVVCVLYSLCVLLVWLSSSKIKYFYKLKKFEFDYKVVL